MDVIVFSEMIETLGFPIAVCAALFWSNQQTVKRYESVLNAFRETLNNNTIALNKLSNRIDKE